MPIDIGDKVKRPDRHDTFEVISIHPIIDFRGKTQMWANLRNLRTRQPANSVNIEVLGKV